MFLVLTGLWHWYYLPLVYIVNGKGDRFREVDKDKFNANYDKIFGAKGMRGIGRTLKNEQCPHVVGASTCPQCDTELIVALEAENSKLRDSVSRFKNAWEDSDCGDAAWEAEVEGSRAALFSQVAVDMGVQMLSDCKHAGIFTHEGICHLCLKEAAQAVVDTARRAKSQQVTYHYLTEIDSLAAVLGERGHD